MRPVVIHYHIFKNAGTSVDHILHHNFKDNWRQIETHDGRKLPRKDLEKFILENPSLEAISSHTAEICFPKLKDIDVIPIIFLRHPIDRIRSAYWFEKNKNRKDIPRGVAETFADYFSWRLGSGAPWQVCNFQAFKLKDFFTSIAPKSAHKFRENAIRVVDKLPMVGEVEKFESSMRVFSDQIRRFFPDFECFETHVNKTEGRAGSMEARLKTFEKEIGFNLYRNLYLVNSVDMELFNHHTGAAS